MSKAQVGEKAPNFSFECIEKIDLFDILDGKEKANDKSDKGKVTQILFYNQFCNHCEQAVIDLDNRAGDAKYKDDVNFLMVSMESLFFHSKYNDGVQVAPPPAPHKVLKNLPWARHVSAKPARDLYNVDYVPHTTVIYEDGRVLTNGDVTNSKLLERLTMINKDAPDFELTVEENAGGQIQQKKIQAQSMIKNSRATVLLFHRTQVKACEDALKRISAFCDKPENSGKAVDFVVVNTQSFSTLKDMTVGQSKAITKAYAGADQYAKYEVETFPHWVLISKSGKVLRNCEFFGGEGEDQFENQIKQTVESSY